MRLELRHQFSSIDSLECLTQAITANVLAALQHPHVGYFESTVMYASGPGGRFEDHYYDLAVMAQVAPSVRVYAQTIPTHYRLDPELLNKIWDRLAGVQHVSQIPLALRGFDQWYWNLAQVAWLAAQRLGVPPVLTYILPPVDYEGTPLPATFVTVYVNVPEED